VREAYPDPKATLGDWSAVDLKPVRALRRPVSLAEIKKAPPLQEMVLLRQARLSVMPVTPEEFEAVVAMEAG
jgi:predicted RNA-binding protein with PUA-like domain